MSNSELAGRFWSGDDGRKLRDGANRQPKSPNEVSLIHSCHERFSLPCGGPWIPPSTITSVMHNAQLVVGDIVMNWHQVAGATVLALFLPLRVGSYADLNVSLLTAFLFFFYIFCLALVVGWERFGLALMPRRIVIILSSIFPYACSAYRDCPQFCDLPNQTNSSHGCFCRLPSFLVIQYQACPAHRAQQQRADRCHGYSAVQGFGLAS